MFNMNVKMKFIEMKAAGMPMYKIAAELGVHRVTLIRWNTELAPYIMVARQDVIEEALFENNCIKLNRVERISRQLTLFHELLEKSVPSKELTGKELEKATATYTKILDTVAKLTKVLLLESSAAGVEAFIEEKKDDIENGISGAVYVTDEESYAKYEQNDSTVNSKQKEKCYNNVIPGEESLNKEKLSSDLINTDMETVEDISEKAPEIREIFNRSLKRNYKDTKSVKSKNEIKRRMSDDRM